MNIRVMTLSLDPATGRFDDGELVAFCAGHRVVDMAHHMVQACGEARLVVIVTWRDEGAPAARGERRAPRGRRPAAELPELSPEEKVRYEALRKWRNVYARQVGKPTYLLFSNAQVAYMAIQMPETLAALGEIPGIGPARLEECGALVLELLQSLKAAEVESERVEDGLGEANASVAEDDG